MYECNTRWRQKGEFLQFFWSYDVLPVPHAMYIFSYPISWEPYTFLYQKPQRRSRITLFLDPFNYDVWLYIFLTFLAIGPILWLVHRGSYFYKVNETGYGGLGKIQHCVWYVYGSILQQGGN